MRVLLFALGFVVASIVWRVAFVWAVLLFVVPGVILGVLMNGGFVLLQRIAKRMKRTADRSHA